MNNYSKTVDQVNDYESAMTQLETILSIDDVGYQMWELELLSKKTKIPSKKLIEIHTAKINGNSKFEPLDIQDFLECNPNERQWIIANYISESTTLVLYADGGVGKTLLAYDLVKSIATGKPWNGYRTQQGKTLVIQTDEPEIDTSERLNIAGFTELPRNPVKIESNWQFSQIRQLKEWIKQEKPIFVMIDSLTSANRYSTLEEKDAAYASVLYELRDIANEYKCSFLLLHHENKSGQSRGTTAIKNNVSEVWRLSKDETLLETQRILEVEKSRSGCSGKYQIELDIDNYSWKYQGQIGQAEKSLKDKLRGFLEDQPGNEFTVNELASQFEQNAETVRRNLENLRRKRLIDSKEAYKTTNGGRQKVKVYYFPVEPCPQIQSVSSFQGSALGVNIEAQHSSDEEPSLKATENHCPV
jgi:RecA-family ATPase